MCFILVVALFVCCKGDYCCGFCLFNSKFEFKGEGEIFQTARGCQSLRLLLLFVVVVFVVVVGFVAFVVGVGIVVVVVVVVVIFIF